MKVSVLGAEYTIAVSDDKHDAKLETLNGYCDDTVKHIVVAKIEYGRLSKKDLREWQKKVIRHEIVHAFLMESGLQCNSEWAENEEMVDWIAVQGLKIYQAWKKANAI